MPRLPSLLDIQVGDICPLYMDFLLSIDTTGVVCAFLQSAYKMFHSKLLRKWIDRLEATPMEKMVLLSALKGNDLTTRNKFVVVRIICSNVLRDNVLKRLKERSDCVKLMKKILKRRYDIQDEDIIMQQLDSVCTEVISEILVKEKKTVKDKGDVSK